MQANLEKRFAESPETLQTIQEHFDEESLEPFTGLETQYKQEKFYRENFDLLVSRLASYSGLPCPDL